VRDLEDGAVTGVITETAYGGRPEQVASGVEVTPARDWPLTPLKLASVVIEDVPCATSKTVP